MHPPVPTTALGYTTARTGDVHDFDFLAGTWTVTNRRLERRGAGSTSWLEFPSTSRTQLFLDGVMNVEETRFPTWSGSAVRTFDREQRRWSIRWVDSRTGLMYPPVHGGFTGDIGEFYGEDTDGDRAVLVRFRWTKGRDEAAWEQAFSYDGATWEVNWTMAFRRGGQP
jgi:hypothetical protein